MSSSGAARPVKLLRRRPNVMPIPATLHSALRLTLAAGLLAALFGGLIASGCESESTDSGSLVVAVSIPPQEEFVKAVGGDLVDVIVMVPPGYDPHIYSPTPSQMQALTKARLYAKVGSGIEFELTHMGNLEQLNRNMAVVDCSQGITLMDLADGEEHEEDGHGGDPHIWMSPDNAANMTENICSALCSLDPENAGIFEANRDAYLAELASYREETTELLAGAVDRRFMVYHPSLGYFARDFDLTMVAINEEGKGETPKALQYVIDQAKQYGIKAILASPQFSTQSADMIASQIGGEVILFDPLTTDYLNNMRFLADELAEVLT